MGTAITIPFSHFHKFFLHQLHHLLCTHLNARAREPIEDTDELKWTSPAPHKKEANKGRVRLVCVGQGGAGSPSSPVLPTNCIHHHRYYALTSSEALTRNSVKANLYDACCLVRIIYETNVTNNKLMMTSAPVAAQKCYVQKHQ